MPLTLPEPITDRLLNSPLRLVVCQVRFEEIPSAADPRVGLAIYESLGGRSGAYPVFGEFHGEQVDVTRAPGSPIAIQQTPLNGWRLVSEDGNWTVVLQPSGVTLETKSYTTWSEDFEVRLKAILEAVAVALKPVLQIRLGLRYIDVITRPGIASPEDWRGWISESLLGPILHPEFGPGVQSLQQQVDIDAGDGTKCTLRHGTVLDATNNGPAYLLDWDVHTETTKAFDASEAIGTLACFNRLALQLFQQAITPDMFGELRGT